jgi:hypothetical protein
MEDELPDLGFLASEFCLLRSFSPRRNPQLRRAKVL